MKEYLKIFNEDGLAFYSDFRIADILLLKKGENTYRMDVDIKTYDGPYSKSELNRIENLLGEKISNKYNYAFLTIERREIKMNSINELEKVAFKIKNGCDEDSNEGFACIYFGWGLELLNNNVYFSKENDELFIIWKAVSGETNRDDKRAKQARYEMKIKVNIVELENEEDLLTRWKRLANRTNRYFEVIRNMSGHKIRGYDQDVYQKIDEEYGMKHSKIAWEITPEIIKKFPRKEIY